MRTTLLLTVAALFLSPFFLMGKKSNKGSKKKGGKKGSDKE